MQFLSISLLRYMVDFRISSGRLFHVDAAIYRKPLPPCCFLLMVGSVSNLEFEFLSGRIHFLDVVVQLSMLEYFCREQYVLI